MSRPLKLTTFLTSVTAMIVLVTRLGVVGSEVSVMTDSSSVTCNQGRMYSVPPMVPESSVTLLP